ncbi:MAG: tetratricopeptide repeat protein [bacterium]
MLKSSRSAVALWVAAAAIAFVPRAALLPAALGAEYFGKYTWAANEIVSGRPLGARLLDFSPLCLGFHVAARSLIAEPHAALVVAQCALGVASALLLFVATRTLFGAASALIATFLYSTYATLLAYEITLEPEALSLFLLAVVLALGAAGRGRGAIAGLGVACGLAIATRPNALLIAPFVLVALFFPAPERAPWRPQPRARAAFFGAGVLAGLIPLAIALAAGGGGFGEAMSGGQVFHQGSNPESKGVGVAYPPLFSEMPAAFVRDGDYAHELYRELAAADLGRGVSAPESDSLWRERALAFIRDDLGGYLRLERRKAIAFFSGDEFHDVPQAVALAERARRLAPLSFALIAALGCAGAAVAFRGPRAAALPLGVLAAYFFSALSLFVSSRQRLPVVLPMSLFAGVAVTWFVARIRARNWRSFAVPAIAAAVLLLPLAEADLLRGYRAEFFAQRAAEPLVAKARAAYDRGQMADYRRLALAAALWSPDLLEYLPSLGAERTAAVPDRAREAVAAAARSIGVREGRFLAGRFFSAAGHDSVAAADCDGLDGHAWFGDAALFVRARSLARIGDEDGARRFLQTRPTRALAAGALRSALADRARDASGPGGADSANAAHVRAQLVALHGETSVAYQRGRAFADLRDWPRARSELVAVRDRYPAFARSRLYLARCHLELEEFDAAAREYEAALSTDPSAHLASLRISSAYARLDAAGTTLGDARRRRWGEALLKEGDPAGAVRVLSPLLDRAPADREIRVLLARALAEAGRTAEARTVALPLTQSR